MNELIILEPVILFRISQAYSPLMSEKLLYDYTRGQWKLSKARAEKAKFGFAVYQGKIKEVYKIHKWYPAGTTMDRDNALIERKPKDRLKGRYEFVGEIAESEIRDKYINRSCSYLFKQGNSNPVMYINC